MLSLVASVYDALVRAVFWVHKSLTHRWILIQGEVFARVPWWISFNPRNPALFTGLDLFMGVTLLVGDGSIGALGPLGYKSHWDFIYGGAFLVAGIMNFVTLLRWRGMVSRQYIRLRVAGTGAGFTVALGWFMLESANAWIYTGDWTRVWPWCFVLAAKLVTAERLTKDATALPSEQIEQINLWRQELIDERR